MQEEKCVGLRGLPYNNAGSVGLLLLSDLCPQTAGGSSDDVHEDLVGLGKDLR